MSIVAEPLSLLSAAVVLVAVLVPVLLLHRKDFTYAVLYDALFESGAEPEGEPQPDDESPTGEVRVVAIEFRNSSGSNIERAHYERPISVGFGEGARIASAEVIEERPPAIGATLHRVPKLDSERVAIDPVLLNTGDRLTLEMVVANAAYAAVEVDGRIVGVREIVDKPRSNLEKTLLIANVGVLFAAAALAGLANIVARISEEFGLDLSDPRMVGVAGGILAGTVVNAILLFATRARRWRRASRIESFVRSRYSEANKSQR